MRVGKELQIHCLHTIFLLWTTLPAASSSLYINKNEDDDPTHQITYPICEQQNIDHV